MLNAIKSFIIAHKGTAIKTAIGVLVLGVGYNAIKGNKEDEVEVDASKVVVDADFTEVTEEVETNV